jgi:hypothetical protein
MGTEKRIELIYIKIIDDRIKRLEELKVRYKSMLNKKFEDTPTKDRIRIENDFNILFFDDRMILERNSMKCWQRFITRRPTKRRPVPRSTTTQPQRATSMGSPHLARSALLNEEHKGFI